MQIGNFKVTQSKSFYNKFILRFFIRLFLLVTIWFFIYGLLLAPNRIIDRPLTNLIAATVTKCINIVNPMNAPVSWIEVPEKGGSHLIQNGVKAFGIWDACNAIDLMFIYVGIIVLLPYPVKRKLIFSVGGVVAIILANIIRVFSLFFIFRYYKIAFDFSHHYLFTFMMYILIFYCWILYTKKELQHEKSS